MKIYLSSMDIDSLNMYETIFEKSPPNILLSYALRNKSYSYLFEKQQAGKVSIALDSGTFTSNSSTKYPEHKITYRGYEGYAKTFNGHFDFVFAYDKHFSEDNWKKNIKYLQSSKQSSLQNVVPVVHSYEYQEIQTYLAMGYKQIALGYSRLKTPQNIAECSDFIHRNGAKVHLLGGMDENVLKNNPISSCDSSSWCQYGIYQTTIFKDPETHTKNNIQFKRDKHPEQNKINKIEQYLNEKTQGLITVNDLKCTNSMWRKVMNLHYFIQLEEEISAYHEKHSIFS